MFATYLSIPTIFFALAVRPGGASDPFKLCNDNKCGDCPIQVTDAGTGFPNCVVYSTESVFGNQPDIPGSDSGGFSPFFNIAQPDPNCKILVRSPATTDDVNCGQLQGIFERSTCETIPLKNSFMVQFCCGTGDCGDALNSDDTSASAKFNPKYLQRRGGGGGGGLYLHYQNGTRIQPLMEGPPTRNSPYGTSDTSTPTDNLSHPMQVKRAEPTGTDCPNAFSLSKRDTGRNRRVMTRSCKPDKDSWEPEGEEYTKTGDNTTIIATEVDTSSGESGVELATSISQTWTTSESVDLGFADVLSIGVSFSHDYDCTVSHSTTWHWNLLEGQRGVIAFTPFFACQKGTYTCDGGKTDPIEICVPYREGKDLAGVTGLVLES
ncbi:hypothetical protein GGR57DRAFT_398951 [Xylariaceae sp. FL1272]|nr:hypothetical protein GGR57DRAFT_398951 [Xylariaceae sp. FL1272]